MKYVYPDIDTVFDTDIDKVNTLIIENQNLFYKIVVDINNCINGLNGKSVLSLDDRELSFNKSVELLSQFIPFELNKKSLINKINAAVENVAYEKEKMLETNKMISEIESFLYNLSFEFNCNINFKNINLPALIKMAGTEIEEKYDSLGEKILDYIGLVTEFDSHKLFIIVNLRSFISDNETELFIDSVLKHKFDIIMIENYEHKRLQNEIRTIIDSELCEI